MDDLEVLEPGARPVSFRGERLEIRPLPVGMIPRIIRTARPVIDDLLKLDGLPEDGSDAMVGIVIDLLDKHAERFFEAVATAVGREQAWIESGNTAEFLGLVQALFEVNRDFFEQTLGPLLAVARAKARDGRGPMPSSSSSSAGTPSPISVATRSRSSGHSRKPQKKRAAGT